MAMSPRTWLIKKPDSAPTAMANIVDARLNGLVGTTWGEHDTGQIRNF